MREMSCPTCGERFAPNDGPHMPFCSRRCQQVDLQRWLTEENGLPVEPEEMRDEDVFDQAISVDHDQDD